MSNAAPLDGVIRGAYDDWRGLDGGETVAWLTHVLQPVLRITAEERRRGYRRFAVYVVERDASPHLAEIWCLVGETHAFLVEWDEPLVTDLEATLERFGPPETRLEDRRLTVGATVVELVYPSRGIAFSIATPFGERTPRRLFHVQLFAPMTVETYITDIGTGPSPYPHPNP